MSLDQATVTGCAWGNPGCAKPEWCSVKFTGDTGEVLSRFSYFLRERLHKLRPYAVIFETPYVPRPRGPSAKGPPPPPMNVLTLRRLLSMAGMIEAACYELRVRVYEVTPAEISKSFLGSAAKIGREGKKLAYIARCAEFGWEPVSTDEADALAAWATAEAVLDPQAASRRRASVGHELALHGTSPPAKAERPARTNREPPRNHDERKSSNAETNTLFGPEIQSGGGKIVRKAR